jgi:hypothetical protein
MRAGESPNTSLHESVDLHIARALEAGRIDASQRCSDAEFLRRAYLDLTGTIPTSTEAREFLGDTAPDKRVKLLDRLLASPEYARHIARVFDTMLMERRPDKHVASPQWREFLRVAFANNKPWDKLVHDILEADGSDGELKAAAKFYLDREGETNLLTRDIGRLFLGINLQCAQCHDHPLVGDYEQDHYYGLFAFLNRSYVFTDKQKRVTLAEKADGEVSYKSVFEKDAPQKSTPPKILNAAAVEEPSMEKGQEYSVAPADGVRPVPKFSRRAQLAPQLASAGNAEFKRNIANRLWALVMGRGLVEPLDMHHSDNEASHPELLQLLASDIAGRQFDLRAFLRELMLSETYQRSSELKAGVEPPAPDSFAVAILRPLSPEQLAWSMMQATGLADTERRALGDKLSEATLHDKLAGNVQPFVNIFGGLPGQPPQEFDATIEQALFLSNGALVRNWLAPRAGNLLHRLSVEKSSAGIAEELYLSILTRPPSEDETRVVEDYLRGRAADRVAALQEMAWALLASDEFRFNH